jgi:elongation factor Ts
MVEIPAAQVKQLRDETGAGMMDAKRALQESSGDLDAAKRLLRERGMAEAGKRAGRETTEGIVLARVTDSTGALVAVGCETEPVSKNEEFLAFAQRVLETVERDGPEAVESLEQERTELVSRIGENIAFRGAARFEKAGDEVLTAYVHPPANKIGVLVLLEGGSAELARQLAMHVSFAAPAWATRDEVPADKLDEERSIYASSDEVQSKPEAAREKIVDGMLNKRFFAAAPGGVLVDQPWIHDSSKTVGQALADAGASIAAFKRLSVSGS